MRPNAKEFTLIQLGVAQPAIARSSAEAGRTKATARARRAAFTLIELLVVIAIIAILAIAGLLYVQFVWLPSRDKGRPEDLELVEAKVVPPKADEKVIKVSMKVKNVGDQDYLSANAQVLIKKDGKTVHTQKVGLTEIEAGKELTKDVVLLKVDPEEVDAVTSPDAKVEVVFSECVLKK